MTITMKYLKTSKELQMIAIIDYDAGNIKSVEKAFEYLSQETVTTRDPEI